MVPSGLTQSAILLIGSLIVLCNAQVDKYPYPIQSNLVYNKNELEERDSVLQCYDCNSLYDPRCGDPFNPYTIGIINCTDRHTPEHLIDPFNSARKLQPTLCRKIVQKVQGKVRVIRGCGYIKDSHDDKKCFRRTGTAEVEVFHCSCTHSLCNTGNSVKRPPWILATLIFILVVTKISTGISA